MARSLKVTAGSPLRATAREGDLPLLPEYPPLPAGIDTLADQATDALEGARDATFPLPSEVVEGDSWFVTFADGSAMRRDSAIGGVSRIADTYVRICLSASRDRRCHEGRG